MRLLPAFEDNTYRSTRLRLTYQASAKDKISGMYGYEWNCNCPGTPANAQQPNLDLFNIFNGNSVFIINQTLPASPAVLSTYNNVLGLLDPRVVRFSVNFNF